MHHITEDTPPDMLAGAMDLAVRLPDGSDVNMAVERSTPMMDLLVQVTTAHKLRPSDYILQALDMSERERTLPYKPNTPIGALDTQTIRVLQKGRPPAPRVPPPPGHQPFESTFRLQVHLPRNQFIVIRVGKFVMLEDIMKKVCEEKNLDPRKYEFRHPANIDKVLDPKRTLNDYEITEITVVHRGSSSHMSQTISSSDIMALQREEERRKLQTKTGGGVLNLIFRRGRTSMGSGSVSSDTRSISPTQSDDSRSVTPPAVQPPILTPVPQEAKQPVNRPKPPQRKRRPAPKPPSQPAPPAEVPPPPSTEKCQEEASTKLENGLTICHSRNSSDSSGYHEASILSDTTLPRRPKSTVINTSLTNSTLSVDQGMDISKSTGNLSNMSAQSKSTMSLTNAGRKKKPPPPPPALKSASSVANISTSVPLVASNETQPESISPTTPSDLRSLPRTSDASMNTAPSTQDSIKVQSMSRSSLPVSEESSNSFPAFTSTPTREKENKSIVEVESEKEEKIIQERTNLTDAQKVSRNDNEEQDDLDAEWQYTLPSPPTAFRDSSPTNFTDMTNYDTVTLNGLATDSVVSNPELFEKLESIKDRSETETIISESKSEEVLTSKYLNLENLEKRKSLVLERELASLKIAQNGTEVPKSKNIEDTIKSQRDNLKNEIEEAIQQKNKCGTLSRSNSQSRDKILQSATDSTLPNFKITTYDQPKSKINIYEDDTVRSNVENKNSTENMFFSKRNSVDDSIFKKPEVPKYKKQVSVTNLNDTVSRSESFSTKNNFFSRSNPVKRSKSHISLDKYDNKKMVENTDEGLHKSSSLFNVSGLQSLEVMRMILPKLGNTPPENPITTEETEKDTTKKYQYSGPPAINLGTWSERPKSQVSIKEDQDYKISGISAIKARFNNQSVNIRVNSECKDQVDSGKINIKVNSEPSKAISHQSNNVIIKIGNDSDKPQVNKLRGNNFYSRFLNQTTAVGYRKPLGNINGVDKPRPHSIAFDANYPDLSRVPIVRAVELKKSVTQIIHDAPKNSSVYLSAENLNKTENGGQKVLSLFSKPVTRGNSFASNRGPVVKGFRMPETDTNKANFSQSILKRTENSVKQQPEKNIFENVVLRKTVNNLPSKRHSNFELNVPPPPPQMPKITAVTKKPNQRQLNIENNKDLLLESIRNFGGKAGLRAVK